MDNPKIIIKRTKEELRRYNLFSSIDRSPFRKTLQFLAPVLGVVQLVIYFFWIPSLANLIIGAFLIVYPFIIRRSIKKASDQNYDSNNLEDYEVTITFNGDNFISETDTICQKVMYSEIYKIYIRRTDIILFLNRESGLFLSRDAYSEETINTIISILKDSVPDKF